MRCIFVQLKLNTLRSEQIGRDFAEDIFNAFIWKKSFVFWFEFCGSLILIVHNKTPLVQGMIWRLSGDKPLSEPRMA